MFFGFSTFVMPAIRRLPPAQAIPAMNAINRAAPNPLFMLALFGAAVACCVLAVWALTHPGTLGALPRALPTYTRLRILVNEY